MQKRQNLLGLVAPTFIHYLSKQRHGHDLALALHGGGGANFTEGIAGFGELDIHKVRKVRIVVHFRLVRSGGCAPDKAVQKVPFHVFKVSLAGT